MKLIGICVVAALLALSSVGVASAGPATGTITILGPSGGPYDGQAHANTPTDVDVSIVGGAPIVAYEYSLLNQCWFSGKMSGPADSFERFDLIGPWFVGADGMPHATVAVNNDPVHAGSVCKVSIINRNTTVKGSTTTYPIAP